MAMQTVAREQIEMPGMPDRGAGGGRVMGGGVAPGTVVLYMGNVLGGPRHGERGVVRRSDSRRVLVDMGRSGKWHIPYYFLRSTSRSHPPAARPSFEHTQQGAMQ